MNGIQRVITRFALLILALFRMIYCWLFLYMSYHAIRVVYENIHSLMQTHVVVLGDIVSNVSMAVFSIICGVAWWVILRKRPWGNRWAVAANLTVCVPYLGLIITGKWRVFFEAELGWWPFILFGIFGVVVFSIPYRGWRAKESIIPAA